jgi:methyl-accepting chemotaxis protein
MLAITAAMRRLADGDHAVEIPALGRKDEVGQMARAVQTFKDAEIERLRLEAEAAEQRRLAEAALETAEAGRIEAARRQSEEIEGLADSLERLAGMLACRLEQALPRLSTRC